MVGNAMIDQLSRAELARVLGFATQCLSVETREDLKLALSELYALVPFRKAVLCRLSYAGEAVSIEDLVNHSYGAEWARVYAQERFERIDPVLHRGSQTGGAFYWHETSHQDLSEGAAKFLDAARDFGVVDGASFACGFASSWSPRTLLSMAGVKCTVKRTLAILTVVGPHLHEAYKRILALREHAPGRVELTPRETEVLNWKQHGKTHWEIGNILGISQRTVKYHFAQIEAKLGVVNASHAVAQALRLGLIK